MAYRWQRPTRRQRQRLISTHRCGILTERPHRLAFGVFCGRDAPSVADLLYHNEGTTSSVLRTARTSDIVSRLARSAASWRRRRASLSPLFGWGCSSYRRTWGCVKCGAASAASWRSRVAARHCYYGPPVSILAKLLRSTCAALSDAIVALANGDHCLSERGELAARPMDLSNIPARSLKIAAPRD